MPINYKEYPANWKELRDKVLSRAKNRCEHCGISNYAIIKRKDGNRPMNKQEVQWLKEKVRNGHNRSDILKRWGFTKIILTIAHLDHDHTNKEVSIERLRALCQRCHLKYDMKRHVENRKYGRDHRKNQFKLEL